MMYYNVAALRRLQSQLALIVLFLGNNEEDFFI